MQRKVSWGVATIIALWAATLTFVLWLQQLFYATSGPFYDSLSYYCQLAEHLSLVKAHGFWHAFACAFRGSNVAMPWIETAFVGLFTTTPALWMGPVLQAPWIICFWLSLYAYFRKALGQTRLISILATIPFIFNSGMFCFNRGWSDFAMDLMSYVVFGNALIFYLWTYKSPQKLFWLLSGIFFALSCYWRATNAVYIAVILMGCETVRLWTIYTRQRRDGVKSYFTNLLWMMVPLVVIAGIFLGFNFRCLYYYYAVWNTDAKIHLPLNEAINHWGFLWQQRIGADAIGLAMLWLIIRLIGAIGKHGENFAKKFGWIYLWCATVPVGFLIIKGAGLNPFVCFPSVFGFLLLLVQPFSEPGRVPRFLTIVLLAGTGWTMGAVALEGYHNHREGKLDAPIQRMIAAVDAMTADARVRGLKTVHWAVPHAWGLSPQVLNHILVYNKNGVLASDGIRLDDIRYVNVPVCGYIPRQTIDPQQLREALAQTPNIDYIYLISEDSLPKGKKTYGDSFLPQYLQPLLEAYRTIVKTPTGAPMTFSDSESVQLYYLKR